MAPRSADRNQHSGKSSPLLVHGFTLRKTQKAGGQSNAEEGQAEFAVAFEPNDEKEKHQ
ncbi:hypothetical protein ACXIZN_05470 [Amycolatopsis sp. TRM77291]